MHGGMPGGGAGGRQRAGMSHKVHVDRGWAVAVSLLTTLLGRVVAVSCRELRHGGVVSCA